MDAPKSYFSIKHTLLNVAIYIFSYSRFYKSKKKSLFIYTYLGWIDIPEFAKSSIL